MPAQRRLPRKAAAVALAMGACCLAAHGGMGHRAFAPAAAPVAAPALPARMLAAASGTGADWDTGAPRSAEAAAFPELEPRPRSGDRFVEKLPEMTLNPPWATCYVESQQTTSSVLEEWVMRGDRFVVASFRAWRRSSEEPTSIRCVDTPAEDALQSVCLECVAPDEVHAHGFPFAVVGRESVGGVMTFATGSPQCMASTARGHGFCKSGQVVLG